MQIVGYINTNFITMFILLPIPLAEQSKVSICRHLLAEIAVSNRNGIMDISFMCLLCGIKVRSVSGADYSSRGVLPRVVFLNVIVKPRE